MSSPLFIISAALTTLVLASCSTLKQATAKIHDTIKPQPKLRLTKADSSRFLPEGTSANQLQAKANPKAKILLAKNTLSQAPASKATAQLQTKTSEPAKDASPEPLAQHSEELPEIQLPPLPVASANDNQSSFGILPSLDGSSDTAFIDVDGENPELPPLEIPDFEEQPSEKPEA